MNERRANIDLAFRNGLKDYEVLPPPDVWDCIDSRVVRKARPAYFMRAAAFLAIAMTMSFLAYRWIGKTASMLDNSIMAENEESSSSLKGDRLKIYPASKSGELSGASALSEYTIAENSVVTVQDPETDNDALLIVKMPETNLRFPFKASSLNIIRHQSALRDDQKNSLAAYNISLEYPDYNPDNIPKDKTSHWSIAALATPTYYGKFNSGSDELSKQIMSSEHAVVSYSGGVTLSYKVNKRFSIQSGLLYSSVGQELEGINSFAGFQKYGNIKGGHNFEVLTTNGTIYTNNPDVFLFANGNNNRLISNYNNDVFDPQKASLDYINNTMQQNFSYLELPFFVRYKLIDKTIDFNLIGGISYNMLLDNSVYTVIDGNKYMIGTTQGMNMFSLSSSVGMGMEYKFSEKLSLNLEPTFRYYLNTFDNAYSSGFHPYSFGIFSGISYKF
jgi:hypothetical protein